MFEPMVKSSGRYLPRRGVWGRSHPRTGGRLGGAAPEAQGGLEGSPPFILCVVRFCKMLRSKNDIFVDILVGPIMRPLTRVHVHKVHVIRHMPLRTARRADPGPTTSGHGPRTTTTTKNPDVQITNHHVGTENQCVLIEVLILRSSDPIVESKINISDKKTICSCKETMLRRSFYLNAKILMLGPQILVLN